MIKLRTITLMALTTLLVGGVAPALAQDSSVNEAYGSNETTNLPFSGLDLGLIAVGGLVLLALGFGLRRATSSQT